MYNKPTKKRSPIMAKPLHYPGQSSDKKLSSIRFERLGFWLLLWFMVALVFFESLSWFRHTPPQPLAGAFITFLLGIYIVIKDRQLKRDEVNLKQGSEGEKAVGQILDELKAKGCAVLHDIVVPGPPTFNIDHVIISPRGIFAVETKTRSKPTKGNAEVKYDGEKIILTGLRPDYNSVKQAIANARWLHEMLLKSTGKSFFVKPVVVFPGWWVTEYLSNEVWVLNPNRLQVNHDKLPQNNHCRRFTPGHVSPISADKFLISVCST